MGALKARIMNLLPCCGTMRKSLSDLRNADPSKDFSAAFLGGEHREKSSRPGVVSRRRRGQRRAPSKSGEGLAGARGGSLSLVRGGRRRSLERREGAARKPEPPRARSLQREHRSASPTSLPPSTGPPAPWTTPASEPLRHRRDLTVAGLLPRRAAAHVGIPLEHHGLPRLLSPPPSPRRSRPPGRAALASGATRGSREVGEERMRERERKGRREVGSGASAGDKGCEREERGPTAKCPEIKRGEHVYGSEDRHRSRYGYREV
ncbi:hypothetical protein BRADI_2g28441v3 [Brachypodium distachyon]|uniref:Uncharacterized protein n=1 Tax=Brachypodium distachyon TaxID=15368 RepID=A0A0Q3ILM7_BRADI|nr:hypothetical protein BRADI_2g28441v3 [Brachypodium distachyon]